MTILRNLFESRNPENPARPLTNKNLLSWLGGRQTATGKQVSETSALAISTVWRCVGLISGVASALPLHAYRDAPRERERVELLRNPHPELTALELWRLAYGHRGLWGNAYLQKMRNAGGQVKELWPLRPDRMEVTRVRPQGGAPGGKMFAYTDDWGERHVLTSREVMHLPGWGYDGVVGVSPIRAASEGLALTLAAEEYGGKLFASGNLMGGILQTEQVLTSDQAGALKSRWQEKMAGLDRSHEVAVLDSGASFQQMTFPAKDSQFLESRTFQSEEIGRWYGVPAFLLGLTQKSTSWGTGLEQQAIGWVKFDLQPTWLAPTEQRITKELLPSELEAKYKVEGLLRGDSAARAAFYRVMREVGALSANDIRELEDLPPVEGGDTYLEPANMLPLGSSRDEGQPAPEPDENEDD